MSVTLYPWSVTACFRISSETSLDGFASGGKGISLLIGSNLNEWTSVPLLAKSAEEKARLEKLSETEILAEAQKLYGDKAEKGIAEYKNAYPGKEIYNALLSKAELFFPHRTRKIPMITSSTAKLSRISTSQNMKSRSPFTKKSPARIPLLPATERTR